MKVNFIKFFITLPFPNLYVTQLTCFLINIADEEFLKIYIFLKLKKFINMKNVFLTLVIAVAVFFTACNNPSTTDNTTTAKDSTGNDAANVEEFIKNEGAKFSEEVKRGDSNALAAHYASDAIVMPPNSDQVKGKDIVGIWGGAIRMGVKDMKLNMADISGGGDVYTETGTFEMTGADNKIIDKGNYVTVWKKDNGNWKIYRDIWNSSMPMPGTK